MMSDRITALESKLAQAEADSNQQGLFMYALALGEAQLEAGNTADALTHLTAAVKRAAAIKNNGGLAVAMALLGDAMRADGNMKRARDSYRHALQIDIPAATARAAYGMALLESDPTAAMHWYEKALPAAQTIEDEALTFSTQMGLARTALEAGKITRAVEAGQAAVADAPSQPQACKAKLLLGQIQMERRRYEDARPLFESVYEEATAALSGEASTLLLEVYRALDMTDKVRELIDTQLQANTDPKITMQMQISLAQELAASGQSDASGEYLNKAHRIASQLGDTEMQIDILRRMAEVYRQSGFGYMALNQYEEAAELAESNKNMRLQAQMLLDLAATYFEIGEPAKAEDAAERAQRPAKIASDQVLTAQITLMRVRAMHKQGQTAPAREQLEMLLRKLPKEARGLRREIEGYLNAW